VGNQHIRLSVLLRYLLDIDKKASNLFEFFFLLADNRAVKIKRENYCEKTGLNPLKQEYLMKNNKWFAGLLPWKKYYGNTIQ
jgi:hypothetical protein